MQADEKKQLEYTIQSLEKQRSVLGDEAVDAAIFPLQQKLDRLLTSERKAPEIQGERKLVTIMFADVSGFTSMSENMDPEAVRDMMNACFSSLVPVIEKYRGTVDKFIGDEIMALFGAPIVREDDPVRALRAALEMMDALKKFRIENNSILDLHIGINTGLVIAGNIGSEGKQQYTVMGDAVNVASRLCDLSETGEIIVGPETYKLTRNAFDFSELEPVRVKGKKEPLPVFELLGLVQKREPGESDQLLRSQMVGRSSELSVLKTALDKLIKGKGQQIAIIGEAGIGKSRLVYEMQQSAGDAINWVKGRALSYSSDMSYLPVRAAIHNLANIPRDAPHQTISTVLRNDVKDHCGDRSDDVFPYLCRLLDIPLDEDMESQLRYFSPEVLKEKLVSAFNAYVKAHAIHKPLVIEWEDLHWSDASSLHMLESMISLTFEVPLIHMFIFRPLRENRVWTFHQQLLDVYQDDYQVIRLSSLSIEQSSELVQNLTQIQVLPEDLKTAILHRAEGNPFFIEELVRSLLDQGYIRVRGSKVEMTKEISAIDIPNTLQEVLAARIDNLPADDKEVLQTASVVGRIFQQKVLKQMLEGEGLVNTMESALRELQKRELIRLHKNETTFESGLPSDLEYIFKHVITQEVTYNTILLAKRKLLHKLAAETLERTFQDSLEDFAATLAFHLERAGQKEKAVDHLIVAANRSRSIYANEEAISMYQAAIASLKVLYHENPLNEYQSRMIELQENLGDVFQIIAKNQEAIAVYELVQAELHGQDRLRRARLYRKMGEAVVILKEYPIGSSYYRDALQALGEPVDESMIEWWDEWIEIHLDSLWLLYWQSLGDEMLTIVRKIEHKVNQLGTPSQISRLYSSLCLAGLRNERYMASAQTVEHAEKSAKAIEGSPDLLSKAMANFLFGFALLWNDKLEKAVQPFMKALEVTQKTGDLVVQTRVLNYMAVLFRRMNDLEATKEYTEKTLQVSLKSKMPEYIGSAYAHEAWISYKENRPGDVIDWYRKASAEWQKIPNYKAFLVIQWLVLFPLLAVFLDQNKLEEAINIASEIIGPHQKKLPDDLTNSIDHAIKYYTNGESLQAATTLKNTLHLAEKYHYL